MQGRQRRECALISLFCSRLWSEVFSGGQWLFWMLGFWFTPWWWGAYIIFLLHQERHWTERSDLTAGSISRSHSKSALLEHPLGTKCMGRAVPPLDTLTEKRPFRFLMARMLKLAGKTHPLSNVSSTTFRLYPMIFFFFFFLQLQIVFGIWCTWEMKPDMRNVRGERDGQGKKQSNFSLSHSSW